jgi:antitoxin HicB
VINENDYKPEVLEFLYQPWTIEIRPYSDGGYFARVVELRGCMTEADSKLEALQQLEDAQAEWLATALEHGDPIPKPMGDSEFSGKIFARTTPHLHRMVSEAALREGVSMSQWVAEVLSRAVAFQEARLWLTQGDALREIVQTFREMGARSQQADFVVTTHQGGRVLGEVKTQGSFGGKQKRKEGMMANRRGKGNDIHVTPRESGKWAVKKSGAQRASSVHENKTDAVRSARQAARKDQSELVVHNRDGRIARKDSHGHDPRRSKG